MPNSIEFFPVRKILVDFESTKNFDLGFLIFNLEK
jgi:hypothetical protein